MMQAPITILDDYRQSYLKSSFRCRRGICPSALCTKTGKRNLTLGYPG
jgi:hypothetical protein